RLMRLFGAEVLFLTNAAGGLGDGFRVGDFMLITDHISDFVPSPLIGKNINELGVRFPDMTNVYDKNLCEIIRQTAKNEKIRLMEGVYCQLTGPNFETPAEIRMFKTLGADAMGMSTAVEAMAARHAGMRICGISMISNLAAGISKSPLSHEEVNETASRVAPIFKQLVRLSIQNIGKTL
ncbi:MAG: purine-nucleoside phosphorylase, partial [Clostridia bacterium]